MEGLLRAEVGLEREGDHVRAEGAKERQRGMMAEMQAAQAIQIICRERKDRNI